VLPDACSARTAARQAPCIASRYDRQIAQLISARCLIPDSAHLGAGWLARILTQAAALRPPHSPRVLCIVRSVRLRNNNQQYDCQDQRQLGRRFRSVSWRLKRNHSPFHGTSQGEKVNPLAGLRKAAGTLDSTPHWCTARFKQAQMRCY
jgi:hypothetical protein